MRLVIDIDGVISKTRHIYKFTQENVLRVKPDLKMIKKVNELFDKGHNIILFTARPPFSHQWTLRWLHRNNIKFNNLISGKPLADYYIDDRNLSLKEFMKLK